MTKKEKDLQPAATVDSDAKETAETVRLAVGLAEEDRREEKSWGINSDPAGNSRQRLVRPDEYY